MNTLMAAAKIPDYDMGSNFRAAFTEIYRQHYVAVHRYVSWRCSSADVDDVVAEVFTVAWRRIAELDESWALAWLLGVTKKVLGDHRRSRRRAATFVEHLIALRPAQITNLETGDLSIEDLDLLQIGLPRLSTDDQEVLVLSAWYQMDASEIGVALSISKNNATVRLHRARMKFRTVLASLEGDET